jgi:hypothetical protein
MKTVFCQKCHKPIKLPNVKIGGKLTVKCSDGHLNAIDGTKKLESP